MGKRLIGLIAVAVAALILLTSILPATIMAASPTSMSAVGDINYISGTVGFPAGDSGNYKVTSRTVSGSFISGDLSGTYSMTYRGNIDLNTQAGNINGQLITDSYIFVIYGSSYPVTWVPSSDSPIGYIGSSSASGNWEWKNGPGSGNFTCNFSFVPTADGHIDYILPGSTFQMSGKWNLK